MSGFAGLHGGIWGRKFDDFASLQFTGRVHGGNSAAFASFRVELSDEFHVLADSFDGHNSRGNLPPSAEAVATRKSGPLLAEEQDRKWKRDEEVCLSPPSRESSPMDLRPIGPTNSAIRSRDDRAKW
jgi:hypothetical protein